MRPSDPRLIHVLQETLISARRHAGITQTDLAIRADAPSQNISRLEGGYSIPSIPTLIAYGEAVGVPAWRLLRHAQRQLAKHEVQTCKTM